MPQDSAAAERPPGRGQPLAAGDIGGREVYALAGMPIDVVSLDSALQRIERAVRERERLFISTPNSNFTAAVQTDEAFRRSVQLSDLVVPDGMPLVLFARMLRLPVQGRVTGADLFEQLLQRAARPVRVFFFGGPDGAAEAAADRVNAHGGMVTCVGHASPGFVSVEAMSQPDVLARINACAPDFLVVALGARKGQDWILRNQALLDVPVIAHLGAVVNFTAGSVKRAPRWMQVIGAEWAWRIYQEPVLWRRYLDDGRVMRRLFFTQVLPQLPGIWLRLGKSADTMEGQLRTAMDGDSHVITLGGDWVQPRQALHDLRQALQRAIDEQAPIVLEVGALREIDAAVVGLLMLAQVRVPSLALRQASPSLRRSMNHLGAAYLLGD